jgi:hypothetical protein
VTKLEVRTRWGQPMWRSAVVSVVGGYNGAVFGLHPDDSCLASSDNHSACPVLQCESVEGVIVNFLD